MEALTALVARLLGRLYGLTADAVCPGGWPWAVSLLGVGVGLLPAAGAAAVALRRRRHGPRPGPGAALLLAATGVFAAGAAPLAVFRATGQVFAAAAADEKVAGLTARQLRSMDAAVCLVGPQSRYLGAGPVAEAFGAAGVVRPGLAVLALVAMPLVAVLFTAASARLATRRGRSRWPARLLWLPLLAVPVLTGDVPAGSAAHLWFGAAAGAFLGMALVAAVGPPDRAAQGSGAQGSGAQVSPVAGRLAELRGAGAARPGAEHVGGPVGTGAGWADRLAARFAARTPEPVVDAAARAAAAPGVSGPVGPRPDVAARPAGPLPVGPRGTALLGGVPSGAGPAGRAARFRLVRRLGAGGFGRVWLAHDARLGQTVALKAAHVRDADTEERIRREARALATVRHPHCVQIHDLVPADGDPGLAGLEGMVIVMEYVRGESLGELVRTRGTLDDVAAARVWSSIAGALAAAHARGVLHRDVKPANVVVDADGQAHLIDFGIARQTGDATLTAVGFVMGTPDFLAPEVAAGGRGTPEADAWQLAATIGYALCGRPPRGEHPDAVSGLRAAALGRSPTHLPRASAHLPLLRAALEADPARRPPLRDVQRALDVWLRAAGVHPDGPVTAVRPTR